MPELTIFGSCHFHKVRFGSNFEQLLLSIQRSELCTVCASEGNLNYHYDSR